MNPQLEWGITSTLPPVTANDLAECERRIGLRLPEDYRRFLLRCNGGSPRRKLIAVPNTQHVVCLDYLYGVSSLAEHASVWTMHLEWSEDLPTGAVAIGHDPGSNPFFIYTSGERQGQVCYWDRTMAFPETTVEANAYWLAASFVDFMSLLREPVAE